MDEAARIHALRGETVKAVAALREAEQAGWRLLWRYARDYDPSLASIRNEPEFKALIAWFACSVIGARTPVPAWRVAILARR